MLNAQVLSLEECKELAVEHNRELQMARRQVKAAEELKKSAFTQFLPRVSGSAAWIHTNKELQLLEEDALLPVLPYTALDEAGHFNPAALAEPAVAQAALALNPQTGAPLSDASGNYIFQNYSLLPASAMSLSLENIGIVNAGVTQPVYMGGKIRETYRMAESGQSLAEHTLQLTNSEVLYEVEKTYWSLVSLKEKMKMIDAYRQMLDTLVRDLENIHEEGIITYNDVLRAKIKRNEVVLNKTRLHNGLELTKMLLCQKTGTPWTASFDVSDSLYPILLKPDAVQCKQNALESRKELQVLDENIALAESGVKIMRSRFLPNIALNGGYTALNPNPYKGFSGEFEGDVMLGVVCTVPIYHFGDRRHSLKAARYEQEVAEIRRKEAEELISLEVQQAVYAFEESGKQLQLATENLRQARENLSLVQDNFSEGMATTRDVLEAQAAWHEAWSGRIEAQTEQRICYCELQKASEL